MIRWLTLAALVAPWCPSVASAEADEKSITMESGVVFPLVESQSSTAFANASWSLGARYDFGVSDNLRLGARFRYSAFDGQVDVKTPVGDDEFTDTLAFHLSAYAPQAIAVYDLWPGGAVSPQLLAGAGYTWMIYEDLHLPHGADDEPFAEGSATASAGLQLQARPLSRLLLTVGAEYTHHFAGLWQGALNVPVTASFVFW